MLTTKKLAGVTSEVNQVNQVMKYISEGIHPKFETQDRKHEVQIRHPSGSTMSSKYHLYTSHHWLGSLLSKIIYIGAIHQCKKVTHMSPILQIINMLDLSTRDSASILQE